MAFRKGPKAVPTKPKPAVTRPAAALPQKVAAPRPSLPRHSNRAVPPKRVDPSSPTYKAAARRYMAFMIATPIFLVTSYALFNRLALGNDKSLEFEAMKGNGKSKA